MTRHEEAARAFFASLSGQDPERWDVVGSPAPKVMYDFASPEDRVFGQCWTEADGKWAQEPLGKQPVILAWKGPDNSKTSPSGTPIHSGGERADELPTAEALVKRAIEHLRKRAPRRQPKHLRNLPVPLWSRVGALFGHGSGYSTAICKQYGFNPYETFRPEES